MSGKWNVIFALVVVGLLLFGAPAYAADETDGTTNVLEGIGGAVLKVVEFVFGPAEEFIPLQGEQSQKAFEMLRIDETKGSDNFAKALFLWVLPAVLMWAILFDFIYLMGFFRRWTAQLVAAIFAIFAAKMGVFLQIIIMISSFLGGIENTGIFLPMLTITLIMMVIWWSLGHIIWGYKFVNEINTQQDAMTYLDKIGTHLNKQVESKKGNQ